jgi:hypothetical protein
MHTRSLLLTPLRGSELEDGRLRKGLQLSGYKEPSVVPQVLCSTPRGSEFFENLPAQSSNMLLRATPTVCDEDITTNDTSTPARDHVIAGPITRARARQLNNQVSSLLSSCSSYLDCGDTCTLVLNRNHGQDRKGEGLAQAGFRLQKSTIL